MKLTNTTLRDLYLKDLELPDTFHGRTTPKVRYIKQWENVQPMYAHANPITIDTTTDQNVWVWSDIHFSHKNIIKYCNRPYPNTDAMNECLIGNHNNAVQPNDIVIWGGDIAFTSSNRVNEILANMPGYKIQIVGNHDINRDGELIEYAVDERHLCYVIDVLDHDFDFQILVTHYPMDNVPKNCINLHGHIHQNTANSWNINMCVEHTNYSPMNLKDVIARAHKYLEPQQ